MNAEDFEGRLAALRPRLHRYCARLTGSAVDGEDVLQDSLIKALQARAEGAIVENLDGWLIRIRLTSTEETEQLLDVAGYREVLASE